MTIWDTLSEFDTPVFYGEAGHGKTYMEVQMSKLTSLKEYNRVTARVREKFRRVRDQANGDFYTELRMLMGTTMPLQMVEALLRKRDIAISDAYKGQREEAALAWQLYRADNPKPGA